MARKTGLPNLVDGNLTVIPANAFLAYVFAGVLHARALGGAGECS